MLETTSESVYQRGICGTGKTLGKIPEFRGCCNRVEQNVFKVGGSFDLEIRSSLKRGERNEPLCPESRSRVEYKGSTKGSASTIS